MCPTPVCLHMLYLVNIFSEKVGCTIGCRSQIFSVRMHITLRDVGFVERMRLSVKLFENLLRQSHRTQDQGQAHDDYAATTPRQGHQQQQPRQPQGARSPGSQDRSVAEETEHAGRRLRHRRRKHRRGTWATPHGRNQSQRSQKSRTWLGKQAS